MRPSAARADTLPLRVLRPPALALAACVLAGLAPNAAAAAATDSFPIGDTGAISAPSAPRPFEGAIGMRLSYDPETFGARKMSVGSRPAIFLRYGRFVVSSGAGFVARRDDDVVRGLGVDVIDDDRRNVSLSLRLDSGRRESSSDRLTGLGDVARTVRLRVGYTLDLDHGWRVGAAWTVDAFGRGGGNLVELRMANDYPLGEVTRLLTSVNLVAGGDRYMQTYFGITEEQSTRSGYPVYSPGFGLRNASVNLAVRTQFAQRWSAQVGVGASRLLGPAARSPIVERPAGWGVNAGLAWHF
jgi:MipA family protein